MMTHISLGFCEADITPAAPNDALAPAYASLVGARILDAARRALAAMRPVRIAWGCAETNIGVNRRNGGVLDRRAGLLKAVDAKTGAPVLALLRLTAHGNSRKSDNARISSDWLGAARGVLSQAWGCPVMLPQGAAGNVAPRFFCSKINPPDADDTSGRFVRTDDALNEMGRAVLRDTQALFDSLRPHEAASLRVYTARGTLYSGVPTPSRARTIAAEAAREAGIDGGGWLKEVCPAERSRNHPPERAGGASVFPSGRGRADRRSQRNHVRIGAECARAVRRSVFPGRLHQRLHQLSAHCGGIRSRRL